MPNEVPPLVSDVAVFLLNCMGDALREAYDARPDGSLLSVVVDVDELPEPKRVYKVLVGWSFPEEIRDNDPDAEAEVLEALQIAASAGDKAALFVIQDEGGAALLVRSISQGVHHAA